jgi:hypothetical protein
MTSKFYSAAVAARRWILDLYWRLRALPDDYPAWRADRDSRHLYRRLSEGELRAARKSDTVFVCGTGYSVLDISPEQWARIGRHDVLSFRDFPRQNFVKADFHVTGEIDDVDQYAAAINDNPLYDDTLFLVQEGIKAVMGNRLLGWRKLRAGRPVYRYRRRGRGMMIPFSRSFDEGVVHGFGSIVGVVNIAYLLGWKHIVLVGIDLYDHRYFFMPPDQTRDVEKAGLTYASAFTQGNQIVDHLGMWHDLMRNEGVQLHAYNPRSLLTKRLPVFDWSLVADPSPSQK